MYIFCKKLFLACIFACTVFNHAAARELTAVNDTLRTGPRERVREDVIINDIIPEGETYSWRIIPSSLPSVSQGMISKMGDYLVFMPNIACRNTSFSIQYELSSGNMKDTATVHIIVQEYNNPVNVLYPNTECVSEMPVGVRFSPTLKYIGKSVYREYDNVDRLDGFSMPLVGDLNGDGKPEIVVMGIDDGGWLGATATCIIILNGQTGAELYRYDLRDLPGTYKLRFDPRHNSVSKMAIADLDRNGTGDIIVTETGAEGRVHCIEPVFSGEHIVGMRKKWTGWTGYSSNTASYKAPIRDNAQFSAPIPYIADINGDGTPEVIVYNKIYDGVTGELVCTLETLGNFDFNGAKSLDTRRTYAYVGRRPGAAWIDAHIPCMAIADINGDGILDIVAGSKVYLMKDVGGRPALDRIIHGPSSMTVRRGDRMEQITVSDGFTAVADIDLDGRLDVVVLSPAKNGLDNNTENMLYVWDPMKYPDTPKAAMFLYTSSYSGTMSYPFVGDINGRLDDFTGTKRLPEICFNGGRLYVSDHNRTSPIAFHPLSAPALIRGGMLGTSHGGHGFNYNYYNKRVNGHVIAFTYHANPNGSTPLHERLKLSWAMEHGDASSCTGITMFDFDNDDIKELCYKDENSLRVISPAIQTYINYDEPESPNGAIRFKYTGIGSFTGFEAPVIADVNMDGSADIVIMAHDDPDREHSKSFVHVFEHAPGTSMWAPCPPVWNQAIYFPLLINENLTVPAKPQSMLTKYEDVNGNTIYPYNGQWIQQPVVKLGEKYVPQVRKPDAILLDMTVTVVSSSSTNVTLTIRNGGSASINAQTPIAFYDGGITGDAIGGGARLIGGRAQTVGVDIFPNEKISLTYRLYGDFNNHLIWARIVDDGRRFPAGGYLECDPSNNTLSGIHCPYLKYEVTASPDGAVCGNTETLLTAKPLNVQKHEPEYQWYRNDTLIPEATAQTHVAKIAGEYKCHIVEDICRGFSTSKKITFLTTPDALISGQPKFRHFGSGDSLIITVPVTNSGITTLKAPFYISAYSNSATTVNKMTVDSSMVALATGKTEYISLTIRRLSSYRLLNSIVIRINDRGRAAWVQTECEYGNNTATVPLGSLLLAHDDRASAIPGTRVKIDVTANDSIPQKCTSPVIEIVNPLEVKGSVSFAGGSMQYEAPAGFTGIDCIACRTSCNGDTAYSKTYVAVCKPLAAKYAACRGTLATLGFDETAGIKHYWYDAEKGGNPKKSASDTIKRIKDGSAMQTFWAEPRNGNTVFPRYRADLELIQDVVSGTVGDDQAICGNTVPAGLNSSPAAGGTEAYTYQWQQSDETAPAWTDIPGATAQNYSPPALTRTTRFRLQTAGGAAPCETVYSNEALITVMTQAAASDIAVDDQRICSGSGVELEAGSNIPSPEYRWYDSQLATAQLLYTGAKYSSPPISSETKYFVSVSGTGYCENLPGERKEVSVDIVKISSAPDVRIEICPMPKRKIFLSSFIDTLDHFSTQWTKLNHAAPDIADAKKGQIDSDRLRPGVTYKYRYSLMSDCGSTSAIAYVHALKNRTFHRIDTVVICKDHESSRSVHLNQILGLELNGEWKYDNTVNPDNTVMSNVKGFPKSSNYCGALIFNARQAWTDAASAGYNILYRGNAKAKKFKFQYSSPDSCIEDKVQTFVIIVTDN
jgi:hypothetical protein